jgi:hypothetical protein
MSKWTQGLFTPKNVKKYVGNHTPKYRSSWELHFMMFLDSNPHVLQWASEAIAIPYRSPLDGKIHKYIPDFFVVYQNKHGKQMAEIVEIKPKKQSMIEGKTNARDRATVAINHAKWASATSYCKSQGYAFRVINENDLFRNGTKI